MALPAGTPVPSTTGKEPDLVQAMFDRVAPRYDLCNRLLSLGLDAGWRRVAARAAQPVGASILDVAAGTGVLARDLRDLGASEVVALDLSEAMLRAGAGRARPGLHLVAGDALRLPFRNATFDAVTIAFGLRNLPDPAAGLREFARVTRAGGRLVVLEFSAPTAAALRRLYRGYLGQVLPRVADLVSSAPDAYGYLARSILAWPAQDELAGIVAASGWQRVAYRNLTGGIVAVHRARRPEGP